MYLQSRNFKDATGKNALEEVLAHFDSWSVDDSDP
jgi:hypothetical protein